jgi:hypothetical protein
MLFAQRVAHPALRHQQAAEMWMSVKNDSEHVPHFALVPIGSGPDVRDARQRKPIFRKSYLNSHIFVPLKGKEMIDHCKIARRLAITMYPHALINGGEVIEHPVRTVYFFFEKAEQAEKAALADPKRGDMIEGVLRHGNSTEPVGNFLRDGLGGDHTSSGSLSTVAFCRAGCIRSRREGRGARTVSCEPTTQLSGRLSAPIAFCNNKSPSRNASGRGGHPGT